MAKYYAIEQNGKTAKLLIYGYITAWRWMESDVSAWSIQRDLQQLDAEEIHVHINSGGGSVSEGFAIYNALRDHPAKIVTHADGFVASAGIFPFLAGDRRIANIVSAFYFHPVQMAASGGPKELRKAADQAEMLSEQGLHAFEAVGVSADTARELEERDDFATPQEMLELGIATEISGMPEREEATQSVLPMLVQMVRERAEQRSRELIEGESCDSRKTVGLASKPGAQPDSEDIAERLQRIETALQQLKDTFQAVSGTAENAADKLKERMLSADGAESKGDAAQKTTSLKAFFRLTEK